MVGGCQPGQLTCLRALICAHWFLDMVAGNTGHDCASLYYNVAEEAEAQDEEGLTTLGEGLVAQEGDEEEEDEEGIAEQAQPESEPEPPPGACTCGRCDTLLPWSYIRSGLLTKHSFRG